MKKNILFAIVICCSTMAMAQDTLQSKHSFRLSISMAFPTGDFNKTEFEDDYPDFARTGTLISASYMAQMHKYFSVGGSVHYRSNPYDINEFASRNDKVVLEANAKPWRSWFTMADAYLHTPGKKIFLKGSVGSSFNRSAYINVRTAYGSIELPADNATAFAWGYGAGTQTSFNAWSFVMEFSQVNTSPAFLGVAPGGSMMEYKQPMSSFNLGVGVTYSF